MYPYFTIWWHKLYAVGIGIVISVCIFLWTAWYHTKQHKLPFSKLFFWLPTVLISCYLLWNWAGMALDSGIWFPLRSWNIFRARLSPYGYHFHFVWLMLWAIYSWRKFFKKVFMKTEFNKRVDVMFFSFAAALIPMGLFLLLGDNFIGKPTEWWYGVIALLNDSARTNFGRVFPLGIIVSIIGFVSYGAVVLCKRFITTTKAWWYAWFALLFFGFTLLFLWQTYPRHVVASFFGYTWDVKNYVALALALYFAWHFIRVPKKRL